MSSDGSFSFPLIDFSDSDLRPGTAKWDLVKSQVLKAAEEYGCFQASFSKIPEDLHKAMSGAMEEMFQLPSKLKKCNVAEKLFHGYHASAASQLESLGITEADNYNKVENFTNILWPEGNIKICKTLHSFSKQLAELDQMVRRMILDSLGVEKFWDEHINSAYYLLRFSKYEAPQTTEKKTGLTAHTDKNITTILYQNQADGLEMQTKEGDWVPAKFSPNSFYIIIGESLHVLTNGRLYSPCHRVMMAGDRSRYAAIFFTMPKEGYIIKALDEFVDEDHPLQYKPFEYGEYLRRRSEVDAKGTSIPPLKYFYGA